MGTLLGELGLRRSDLDDPDTLIPCAVTGALFERAQLMRPLKNLWTRLAAETPVGTFPLFDYLIVTSDSVGDGFKQLARHFRLIGAPFVIEIHDDENPIRVIYLAKGPILARSVEYGVTLDVRHFRAETENRATFAYVSYTHEPDDASEIERLLGCPVRSGASWAGLALPRAAWQLPLRRRDPVLRSVLEGHADAMARRLPDVDGLALDVRRLLASHLAWGGDGDWVLDADPRDIIAHAAASPPRRWDAYQRLLDAVRRDTAERCMVDPSLSIGEVSYLIGYSEPAAFHRAFKRWYGMTPERFRERRRAQG